MREGKLVLFIRIIVAVENDIFLKDNCGG